MALNSLDNSLELNQENSQSMDGREKMDTNWQESKPYRFFLDNLIREYCTYKNGSYEVLIGDVSDIDKKMFLSYLISIEEYEDYISNPVRLIEAIADHEPMMQDEIDERKDDLYVQDMEECGMVLGRHSDNGEVFWYPGRVA